MPAMILDVAVRAALIALATGFILWALRIRTAAIRHAAWTSVVVAMLILPIWSVGGPKLSLAVLPASGVSLQFTDPGDLAAPFSDPRPAPTATAASASDNDRGWDTWAFVVIYVLGAVALLLRLAIGTVYAHRLRRMAVVHAGRPTSARCATPITVGWLSPILILPEGWQRWSAAQLDAVLTHEREHARRRDPLVQWIALFNRAIFWFHPLSWWLERRLAGLAEEACDAAVIRSGHSPQDYSDYLVDMAHALRRQGRRLRVAGMAMPGSGLPDRMRHIFEETVMTPTPRAWAICTLAFCMTSAVIFAAGTLVPRPSDPDSRARAAGPVKSDVVLPAPGTVLPADQPPREPRIVERSVTLAAPRARGLLTPGNASDFSGNWALVSSTYTGRGRGGGGGSGSEVMVSIASGAPVNCGTGCTIVQDTKALTITRPDQPGETPPDIGVVQLNLDGSDSTITQANGTTFPAKATLEGGTVIVTRHFNYSSVKQTLSIEDGRLIVVTIFSLADAPVTLRYVKR